MNLDQYQSYVVPAAFVAFFAYRFLKFRRMKAKIPAILKQGGVLVDVRSPSEYSAGHVPGSINIPLGELAAKVQQLDRGKPVVLCCASGMRSGMAVGVLKKEGFAQVFNAGPWTNALG